MTIELQWENPAALEAAVREMLEREFGKIKRVPAAALRKGAFLLQREIRANVRKLQRTPGAGSAVPTLNRSVGVQFDELGGGALRARIGSQLLLLLWLERGTGLHGPLRRSYEIRPRIKKALYWGAKDAGGNPIIRKRVIHPGMKPRRPVARAVASFLPLYVATIIATLREERAKP